jgi:hypothetical protein
MIFKVGFSYPVGDKRRKFSYRDVHYDEDGWAETIWFLPGDFDLSWLQTDDGVILPGWHTGHHWDGLNFKSSYNIVRWKRKEEEEP